MCLKRFFKSLVHTFQRFTVTGRIRNFVNNLEDEFEEMPECYEKSRELFDECLKDYITLNTMYVVVSLVFYASIISSVTAALGFEINVFEQLYSVFGFTTAAIVYFVIMFLKKFARVDLENSRSRLVSCLFSCTYLKED